MSRYNNSELAHRWVYASEHESGKGSNFYFEGNKIYSYGSHFLIASKESSYYLFNEKEYSNTTSRHKSYTLQAIPDPDRIIYAYLHGVFFDGSVNWSAYDTIKEKLESAKNSLEHLSRSRSEFSLDTHLRNIRKAEQQINLIVEVIEFDPELQSFIDRSFEEIEELILSAESKHAEKLQRAQELDAKREERREKKRDADRQYFERIREENKRKALLKVDQFLNGEISHINGLEFDLLRIDSDGSIRTSQGLIIERAEVLGLIPLLHSGTLQGQKMSAGYAVTEVSEELIKIGCHTFERSFIDQFIKQNFEA